MLNLPRFATRLAIAATVAGFSKPARARAPTLDQAVAFLGTLT